jgi:hypothetical protein
MIQFDRVWCSVVAGVLALTPMALVHGASSHDANRSHYSAPMASEAPQIDGIADDAAWQQAEWRPLNNLWLGPELSAADFQGRYKVVWTPGKLFVLVEFVDDVLIDSHRNPLVQYWDDDCLEIFIDENHSGGDHQYNHNAFAYHLSLDNQAIDIGTDKQAHNYSSHVKSQWLQQGNKANWEVAIDIYTDAYQDGGNGNHPTSLEAGKIMGFMLAYCDNDGSELRENFIGSEFAAGESKDRGWIDAGLFGTLELVD